MPAIECGGRILCDYRQPGVERLGVHGSSGLRKCSPTEMRREATCYGRCNIVDGDATPDARIVNDDFRGGPIGDRPAMLIERSGHDRQRFWHKAHQSRRHRVEHGWIGGRGKHARWRRRGA